MELQAGHNVGQQQQATYVELLHPDTRLGCIEPKGSIQTGNFEGGERLSRILKELVGEESLFQQFQHLVSSQRFTSWAATLRSTEAEAIVQR